MALTGLQIYKLLPMTNCRECGFPTCLAFAMKLAAKQVALDQCPYVTPEAQEKLQQASRPPVELVTIGKDDEKVEIGRETVLFRHLDTFVHSCALAVTVEEDDPRRGERVRAIQNLQWERIGQTFGVEMIALVEKSGRPEAFAGFVEETLKNSDRSPVLVSDSPECLAAALEKSAGRRPLIHAATVENLPRTAELARAADCPLVVRGRGLDETAELSRQAREAGVKELVLDTSPLDIFTALQDQVRIRRFALNKLFRPLGYPTLARLPAREPLSSTLDAVALVAKYAAVLVTDLIESEYLFPLLTMRQNIYTDPQKPDQVEPGLYPINNPGRDAPLLVTTNFSLTYFTVRGEIENSRVGSLLLVIDTEGTSVLTAWAADKLNPRVIKQALEKTAAAGAIDQKRLVLPGYVAVLSGKLEEESGWEVKVGPREASGIPRYLRNFSS